MNWTGCSAIEYRPDIHGGAALLKGTRLTVEDSILGNLQAGVAEAQLPELFPVLRGKEKELRQIIEFVSRSPHATHPL